MLGRHATSQRGLSLIELLIIVAFIATLATIALLFFSDVTEQTRVARAIADLATIGGEIDTFEYMNDRLPNGLAEIGRAGFKDPWGNAYVYSRSPRLRRATGERTTTWSRSTRASISSATARTARAVPR